MTIIEGQTQRHYRKVEALISGYETGLSSIVTRAQAKTFSQLQHRLKFENDGLQLRASAANVRVLSKLPQLFLQAMEENGYPRLVHSFLSEFDGQVRIFEEIMRHVSRNFKVKPAFTAKDLDFFESVKVSAGGTLDDAIEHVAERARFQALFTIGGMPFDELVVSLADRLHMTVGESRNLAATSVSTFYRTVANRGYKKIEDELDNFEVRYTYVGPPAGDKLIRPFCKRLMAMAQGGRTWTRAEIEAMSNGQLPNVFETCGGYNCRHQWVIAEDPE